MYDFIMALGILGLIYFPIVFWEEHQELKRREKENEQTMKRIMKKIKEGRK